MRRVHPRSAWAGAAAIALLAVVCSSASASAFVADTRIAYASWVDGDADIYTMNSDGSDVVQLTSNSLYEELFPSWSPDGTEIAFSSTQDGGDFDIYVMDAAGQNVTRLTTDAGEDWIPAWSPDGSRIAFVSHRTGVGELYVINTDGSNLTQVTYNPDTEDTSYEVYGGGWGPDGVLFVVQTVRYGNSDIYIIDLSDGSEIQLTTDEAWDFWPSWSPDGTTIAYSSDITGVPEIYAIAEDGTVTALTSGSEAGNAGSAWSPDSTMIAFEYYDDTYTNIYVMNADGSGQTALTANSADDWTPAWSPVLSNDVVIYVVGGTALDDTGSPISDLTIVVNNQSRLELETTGATDSSGVFTISLFDAYASVVTAGDTITVDAYDGDYLVGSAEVTLSQTDIDGGVTTVELDIKLPVPIMLNGVGFDAYPLVAFTELASDAAVSATPLSLTDKSILSTALETTLLQLVIPGYPNTAPVMYPDYGNSLVSDNLGNPMTFPVDWLVPEIGNLAGYVPRVLAAPSLNVLATTDGDMAGVTMSLYGPGGSAEAYVLRVDSGTLVPYTFVFDSAAALNFLAAWAGGAGVVSIPSITSVNAIIEERDASTGSVLNTLSAPLTAIDNVTWATGDPVSLTPGRVVQYVYEVTLAGDVELADGTLVSSWVLPDPYNFQWVDVADGASAIARIANIGPSLGLSADGNVDP